MSIELPNARNIFVPVIPPTIEDRAVRDYLLTIKSNIENGYTKAFDNAKMIVDVINTGTSGTFKSSAGAIITVAGGLIIALT